MMPRVDVVVLTWNDGALVDEAIDSALASVDVDVRVVVVDNGSDPAAPRHPDPRVRLLRNDKNEGVARARNLGVRAGDAELVCFLDSDARLAPECLRTLAAAVAVPDVGVAVPVFEGQTPEASAGRAPKLGRKLLRLCNLAHDYAPACRVEEEQWNVDFGIGACQLFRRDAFDAVGGLDEAYFYGPEDLDYCLRVRRHGWRIVQVLGASCAHPPRRRFRGLLTRRGIDHAAAVTRHLWRHRRFQRSIRDVSA